MEPSRYLKGQLLSTVLSSRALYFFKALASICIEYRFSYETSLSGTQLP